MGFKGRMRVWRARERYMPLPRRIRRGTTALIAIGVILVSLGVSLILDRRSAAGDEALIEWARENAVDPFQLIERETRSRSILLLGDIIGASAPKRLAEALIDSLGLDGRLEAVALEVPADQQPWIDLYLATYPEDTSVLLAHARSIRAGEGGDYPLLGVYRTVWRVNQVLGANRRIRIIALDSPDWPPQPGFSPARALATFAIRDSVMLENLDSRILERDPRSRVLVFVDGLRVIDAPARVRTGGAAPVQMRSLASRLLERQLPVYAVLVDAPRGSGAFAPIAGYHAGPLHRIIRSNLSLPPAGIALPIASSPLNTSWLPSMERPGIDFQFLFASTSLDRHADAWVFLN